ncbi:ABC transporter transmembrane domain-containing protein [Alsobacter sp. SYSU M60028]|uniref:ABC transporter transmembrane domain-containing protein n=1 Tax=Alsobacter ponti TaxID=2962936 RepID=A0ABT1LE13_9HYPH|nr:ABC transporter transmembrane domain-containing protein [Alsobacter ponti]MCP8938975.1 ABC transporter transmembrane domain-containing protein [Alsobacter ponti]
MEKNLFRYIWRHSAREQLVILAIVLVSMVFYFLSLDLPRTIVNDAIQGRAYGAAPTKTVLVWKLSLPAFLGGGETVLFSGVDMTRMQYLFALSGLFLLLVIVNGAFKYVINVRKGALGERVLQRMRSDLFAQLVRFTPEQFRNVKASEAATMIKDEVEPVGGFVGDAFIQPVFLGGQALTAMAFILLQSVPLGLIAGGIVLVQALVIPKLRREQLRLGKQRQLQSRALAGAVGEVVDSIAAVQDAGAVAYEQYRIDRRLETLYQIRFALYNRKFVVKFLNNFLAQITPFLFYLVGGYYALTGSLDIGQLVAVIAAYRDLPPPVKELIDWDQQRMDVDIKYEQVVEQFTAESPPVPLEGDDEIRLLSGTLDVKQLQVVDARNAVLLEPTTLSLNLPCHAVFLAQGGDAADLVARAIGAQITRYAGQVQIAGHTMALAPLRERGRRLGFVDRNPIIFNATIRANLLYALNQRRPERPTEDDEAWIDFEAAGARDAEDLDRRLVEALECVGLADGIYQMGLNAPIDAARYPDLPDAIARARPVVREVLAARGAAEFVESFDPQLYNRNATLGENLLFGVPRGKRTVLDLVTGPEMAPLLAAGGLIDRFVDIGRKIAEITVEIFSDLPPGSILFERFSFIASEDLPVFRDILARAGGGSGEQAAADRRALLGVALPYIESRHRLDLVDGELEARIVAARRDLMRALTARGSKEIEFYDPEHYCSLASIQDNLLFGRISFGAAGAGAEVMAAIRDTSARFGLELAILRVGLDSPAGYAGKLLSPYQRAAISVARDIVKSPDVLVLNEVTLGGSEAEMQEIVARIRARMAGRTLILVTRSEQMARGFDARAVFSGQRLVSFSAGAPLPAEPVSQIA